MEADSKNGLIVFYHPLSSYSQMVLMTLYEKKLHFAKRYVNLIRNEQHVSWYLKLNPLGEVPVLCDGMKVLPESNRIIDYLEDNFSDDKHGRVIPIHLGMEVKDKVLYYRDLLSTISIKRITFGTACNPSFAPHPKPPVCSTLFKIMKYKMKSRESQLQKSIMSNPEASKQLEEKLVIEKNLIENIYDPGKFADFLNEVESKLEEVEKELLTHYDNLEWLCCDEFTVADVHLAVLLNRLYYLGYENMWKNGRRPCLELYFDKLQARLSFQLSCLECPAFMKLIYIGDCVYRTMPVILTVGAFVLAWVYYKYS